RGAALSMQAKDADAISTYDELISRFGTSSAPGVQEHVAAALRNKGDALGRGHRPEGNAEQISVYDELISRFGTSSVPGVQEQVAMAVRNKHAAHKVPLLGHLGRVQAELAHDELVARFGKSSAPGAHEQLGAQ